MTSIVPKVIRAPSEARPSPPIAAELGYVSEPGRVFWIGVGGAIATILTVGLYRFWLRTYLRRHHWSRMTLAGDAFEYRGRAIELLSGALIAIVILALYLTLVATFANFIALVSFEGDWSGASGLVIIFGLPLAPLWPYAAYRARRYFLTRLSWRGIRFSLDLEAWRYVRLTLWLWFLTAISLGLLKPYADFRREKFVIDRTWFGDQRLALGGSPAGLFRGYAPLLWCLAFVVAGGAILAASLSFDGDDFEGASRRIGAFGLFIPVLVVALFLSYFWYLSFRLKFLVENTRIGDIPLVTTLTSGRVFRIYMASIFLTGIVVVIAGALLGWLVLAQLSVWLADSAAGASLADLLGLEPFEAAAVLAQFIIALGMFGIYSACSEAFFFTLALNAVASTTTLPDLAALEATRQRDLDRDHSAEGFADALGVDGF